MSVYWESLSKSTERHFPNHTYVADKGVYIGNLYQNRNQKYSHPFEQLAFKDVNYGISQFSPTLSPPSLAPPPPPLSPPRRHRRRRRLLLRATSRRLPLLQHHPLHPRPRPLPRLPPHPPRENHPTLHYRSRHPPPRHPRLRMVVGIPPRPGLQRPRSDLQWLSLSCHRLSPGDPLSGQLQPHPVALPRPRHCRRSPRHAQHKPSRAHILGAQHQPVPRPRWGRGQETPGEDPFVISAYAVEYVKGFQEPMRLSACCKHYTAYDLEKWGKFSRYSFDAVVTEQDMADTFEPPFRSCVEEGRASCLMCSYNAVNGVPACARGDLLRKAREEWGFQGYVTSDCDAVATVFEYQNYTASPEDAVGDVLKAGVDINCGTYLLRHTAQAIKLGKVSEEDIDRALFNLFSVQLRLGLFDGDQSKQRYGQLGPGDVCTDKHRKLALEAAKQGIVLLKNENDFLPLRKKEVSSVAIIGPAANDTSILGGDYTGVPCNPISFFEGLHDHVQRATFAPGCLDVPCNSSVGFKEAIKVASEAEVVIVVAGLNLTEETEDHDRTSLLLPGKQMDLVNAIAEVSKKPLVLVLMGGGPLDVSFAKENPKIASILWIGYPGEVGGQVLAEALFGEFNPGGRLPVTWYPESFTKVPMNNMNMRPDPSRGYPGRTYRFYTGEVVYEFGYGLSYSSYSYKFVSAPSRISLLGSSSDDRIHREPLYERKDGLDYIHIDDISSCETLRFPVQISVANIGAMDGSHTVILFSKSRTTIKGSPQKQLIGFEQVHTTSGRETEIVISVDPCKHMSTANEQGKRVLSLGHHILLLEDVEHVLLIQV